MFAILEQGFDFLVQLGFGLCANQFVNHLTVEDGGFPDQPPSLPVYFPSDRTDRQGPDSRYG